MFFYATELANKPSSLVFKRDEDEKRTSTVQRSTSGILSSLTTELGKGVVASNSYSNSPKTRGGATITKNFESLIRQPSLTNLFDYKATTTNASPLPSVRKNNQQIFVCFFVFLYPIFFMLLQRHLPATSILPSARAPSATRAGGTASHGTRAVASISNEDLVFGTKPVRPARRDRRRPEEISTSDSHLRGVSLERPRHRSGSLTSQISFHHEDEDVHNTWNTSIEEQTRLLAEIQRNQRTIAATASVTYAAAPPATAQQQTRMVEEEKKIVNSSDETRSRFSSTTSRSSRWEQFSTRHEETSMADSISTSLTASDNAGRLTKTTKTVRSKSQSASAKKSQSSKSIVDKILTKGAGSRHIIGMSDDDETDMEMPDLTPFSLGNKTMASKQETHGIIKSTRTSEKRSRLESSSLVDQYIGRQSSGQHRGDSSERGSLARRPSMSKRPEEMLQANQGNLYRQDSYGSLMPEVPSRKKSLNTETRRDRRQKENQSSTVEKSKSQGNLRRQGSRGNLSSYLPEDLISFDSPINQSRNDLVFGQTNPSQNDYQRINNYQIPTNESGRLEKSGSQGNLLRRQESLTELSNYLQEDLSRKWSFDASTTGPSKELGVFGQKNRQTILPPEMPRNCRQENQSGGSQTNLRRQNSMTNLNSLQDDINSLLRDTSTAPTSAVGGGGGGSSTVQTSTRCDTYISGNSGYQAIASSLLSEPAPR